MKNEEANGVPPGILDRTFQFAVRIVGLCQHLGAIIVSTKRNPAPPNL